MKVWEDPRVKRGMAVQLKRRRELIAAGGKPIGWKIGFGAQAIMQRLNISGPLVGFLMQAGCVPSGGSVSLGGWVKPVAEPEVAVYMGKDLAAGADRATAAAAIAALGPAIELADLVTPPDDVEAAVAGNIYQRHVVFGPRDASRAGGRTDGLVAHIFRRGEEFASTDDFQATVGELIGLVQHVAAALGAFGEKLSAGEVIITGAVVPPPTVEPDETDFTYELAPVGRVSVAFAR
jgi:2-keto-4-pentenoate hydratase